MEWGWGGWEAQFQLFVIFPLCFWLLPIMKYPDGYKYLGIWGISKSWNLLHSKYKNNSLILNTLIWNKEPERQNMCVCVCVCVWQIHINENIYEKVLLFCAFSSWKVYSDFKLQQRLKCNLITLSPKLAFQDFSWFTNPFFVSPLPCGGSEDKIQIRSTNTPHANTLLGLSITLFIHYWHMQPLWFIS